MTATQFRPDEGAPATDAQPLLDIQDLRTHFHVMDGVVRAVDACPSAWVAAGRSGSWVSRAAASR